MPVQPMHGAYTLTVAPKPGSPQSFTITLPSGLAWKTGIAGSWNSCLHCYIDTASLKYQGGGWHGNAVQRLTVTNWTLTRDTDQVITLRVKNTGFEPAYTAITGTVKGNDGQQAASLRLLTEGIPPCAGGGSADFPVVVEGTAALA